MKTSIKGQVIGIPIINSIAYPLDQRSPKPLLTNTAATHLIDQFPDDRSSSSASKRSKVHSVLNRMNKFGKKADSLANGIKEHVKLGTNISETVTGKLRLGARILRFGGFQKVFKHLFCVREGEKLLKASQCYLSTSAGPISGLLFVSTEKIAFCSQKSVEFSSSDGELLRARYKVVIPMSKIKRIDQSENAKKPSQKYIEIVTVDDFDFWFMGFLNYKKAFQCLQESVSQS